MDHYQLILALDDKALERFTRDWVSTCREGYAEVHPYAAAQDLGRDVVGFLTRKRHEGPWHNYQCKQYKSRRVPLAGGLLELAKVFYHASQGAYTLPERYFFVAPHGLARPLELLIDRPTELGGKLVKDWEKSCAGLIAGGEKIKLTGKIKSLISAYDFSNVTRISLEEMLFADRACLVLHKHLNSDPGPAPLGDVPEDVQDSEQTYIGALVAAYGERDGTKYDRHGDVLHLDGHGTHFRQQRERFFDADVFKQFYRDNTARDTLPRLERDIFHGVSDVHRGAHPDSLARIDGVMAHAATLQPGGPLGHHAGITVKQGFCHHFVNDEKLTWCKT